MKQEPSREETLNALQEEFSQQLKSYEESISWATSRDDAQTSVKDLVEAIESLNKMFMISFAIINEDMAQESALLTNAGVEIFVIAEALNKAGIVSMKDLHEAKAEYFKKIFRDKQDKGEDE